MKKSTTKPTAPDSDLVKLTKEFELLKKQLKNNEALITDYESRLRAQHIEHEMTIGRLQSQCKAAFRARLVLEAQFRNAQVILSEFTQQHLSNGCCQAEPSRPRY